MQGLLRTVVLARAALLVSAAIPLARDAMREPLTIALGGVSLLVLLWRQLDPLWVIGGAAAVSLAAALSGLVPRAG